MLSIPEKEEDMLDTSNIAASMDLLRERERRAMEALSEAIKLVFIHKRLVFVTPMSSTALVLPYGR